MAIPPFLVTLLPLGSLLVLLLKVVIRHVTLLAIWEAPVGGVRGASFHGGIIGVPQMRNACYNILALGFIGLIGYSYYQVATCFKGAYLQRTLRSSVLSLEKFQDG
jgi:hypothetical protein